MDIGSPLLVIIWLHFLFWNVDKKTIREKKHKKDILTDTIWVTNVIKLSCSIKAFEETLKYPSPK